MPTRWLTCQTGVNADEPTLAEGLELNSSRL